MKTTDFNVTASSAQMNESMFRKFGTKINFDKYTREDLENYRNLLRTKLNQTESSAGFNDLLANEGYQKDKFMLNLLNTKIKEMLGESVLNEKSKSQKQARTMAAAAHDPKFAKKVGIKQGVAKEFNKADTGTKQLSKAMKNKTTTEASHQAATTMKHVKNPTAGEKKAAKDIKPGVKGYKDRVDMLKSAEKDGRLKERVGREDDEHGGGPTPRQNPDKGWKPQKESWDDMTKSVKDKAGAQPNGGAGVKAGKAGKYGKDVEAKKPETGGKGADAFAKRNTKTTEALKGGQKKLDVSKPKGKLDKADFAALRSKKKVKEDTMRGHYRNILEGLHRLINEDEEGKAKDITAGSDMVNDFTSWMQRVGQYQTKSMIELADSIRANFGQAEADAFRAAITPALQEALSSLTQSRETITRAVAVLAGEESEVDPMGMDPSAGGMPGDDGALDAEIPTPDTMNAAPEDAFGASDAAAGGAASAGREMRESKRFALAKRLQEAHSIMSKLAK